MADATAVTEQISAALDALATQVIAAIPQSQSFMEIWGWNCPAINKTEFAEYIRSPIGIIQSLPNREVSDTDLQSLNMIPARIAYFQAQSLPQLPGGNCPAVYATARSLIDLIIVILSNYQSTKIDWEKLDNEKIIPSGQMRRLKQLERHLNGLSAGSDALAGKVDAINDAYVAATGLPTTLLELNDARSNFEDAGNRLKLLLDDLKGANSKAEGYLADIGELQSVAEKQVKNIDAAYSAATTQGLGKAFGDKAKRLSRSTWALILVLAITLAAGAWITALRVNWLHQLMEKPSLSMSLLWVNVALTVISVAGPIWFAWLLTKQIGQRFRLAEDYDFKASVAKAYEGYRREAAHVDPEQGKRLFSMALDRLSEEPLRHVEAHSHGSPVHEFMAKVRSRKLDKAASIDYIEKIGADPAE